MKSYFLFTIILSFLGPEYKAQTIQDIDGNLYNTVTIGTQTWMQENLRTTRFNNAVVIPTTTSPISNDTNALYQWAYNDDSTNATRYGLLYTWNVVNNSNNVCPSGWHVPNNAEWETLISFLGGDSIAGGKMKDTGTAHWTQTNISVNNSSGFTGLGHGFRGNPSGYSNLNVIGSFWSTTPFGIIGNFPRGYLFRLEASKNSFVVAAAVANNGHAIRCLKDSSSFGINNSTLNEKIKIFPNPAKDRISISFEQKSSYHLLIYDVLGNLIHKQSASNTIDYVDIAFLPRGTYLIQIITDENIVIEKFIKE